MAEDTFNPFAVSPEFSALVLAAQQRARTAPPAPADPIAASRAAALKQFSSLTDEQREAVLARLRARR